MKFPFKTTQVFHRNSGKVVEISGIEHIIDKPQDGYSRDYWFYVGVVEWDDLSISKESHIYPYHLCTDEGSAVGWKEINDLNEAMMAYLNQHGTWRHEEEPQGWSANDRTKYKVK